MSSMAIGEVAAATGVSTSAIRYYESLGILPAPARAGGKRRYGAEIVPRVRAINLFKQAGFTMAEMQVLLRSEPLADRSTVDEMAQRKLHELEQLVQQARIMMEVLETVRRCGCLRLEECPMLEAL